MAYPTVSAPYGFLPQNLTGGLPFAGSTRMFRIASGYAANIGYGDPVKLVTAGGIERDAGTSTMTPVGIFLGCTYTDPTLKYKLFSQYWPTGTVASDALAYVCDDPNAIFKIAVCSTGTTMSTLTTAAIGANAGILNNAASTTTGNSAVALDSTTVATTNTLPLRIIDVVTETAVTATTFCEVLVRWNATMHQYNNSTGV